VFYGSLYPGGTFAVTATLQAIIPFRTEHPFALAFVSADVDPISDNNEARIKVNFVGSRAR
jgi:hypothetical protein